MGEWKMRTSGETAVDSKKKNELSWGMRNNRPELFWFNLGSSVPPQGSRTGLRWSLAVWTRWRSRCLRVRVWLRVSPQAPAIFYHIALVTFGPRSEQAAPRHAGLALAFRNWAATDIPGFLSYGHLG